VTLDNDDEPSEQLPASTPRHDAAHHLAAEVTGHVLPAWRRATRGEARWPVTAAVVVAVVLQVTLPRRYAPGPPWLLPVMETLLLVGLIAVNPIRIERHSPQIRALSLVMIVAVTLANVWSAARLVDADARPLTDGLGADLRRLPLPLVHQRNRVQPDRYAPSATSSAERSGSEVDSRYLPSSRSSAAISARSITSRPDGV
jgi:hypothetical protein